MSAPVADKYDAPIDDGMMEVPTPAIDAEQVQVLLPNTNTPAEVAPIAVAPAVPVVPVAAPTAVVASPTPSPVASPAPAVSSSQMALLRSQVSPACHFKEPSNGDDGNVFVHVIDGVGAFSCTPTDLTYLVHHASNRPNEYSVVGVMGCQSSGKSTLLNLLFGSQFQEMDSSKGRSQTTKGVWMDSGCRRRDLVIMDLEGTDSGERGEDRTTFERQTSLYALAVAEVLMINMWEHDIGRYTASNYGILKTVFEVNLQLFDTQNKTVLMFVIRDHIEEDTPIEQLVTKLRVEVAKIWSEIRKPDRFATTPVEDLFELRFCALPHMKLQKAAFKEKVDGLRAQFTDATNGEYLFGSDFHGRKRVPADGFGVYMQNCWTTIKDNKELNLPTQKEMLATFRCDEIIAQLYAGEFVVGLASLRARAAEELIADQFAADVNPLLRSILRAYTDATQHYHTEIVAAKKAEFLRKMSRELEELFVSQARTYIRAAATAVLQRELKARLTANGKATATATASADAPHPDFTTACDAARSAALEYAGPQLARFQLDFLAADGVEAGLDDASHAALVQQWASLVSKVESELNASLDSVIGLERASQLKKLSFHLDKLFKTKLSVPLNALLKKANPTNMWHDVGELYREVRAAVVEGYVLETLLPTYAATRDESTSIASQADAQLAQLVRLVVDQYAAMIGVYMRSKFDRLFRSEPNGRPRTWTSGERIRPLFRHARDEALKQLDLFAVFRLDEYKDAESPANLAFEAAAAEEVRGRLSRKPSLKRVISLEPTATADSDDSDEYQEEEEAIGQTTIDYSQVDAANIILDPTQRLEKESQFRFEIEGALREAEIAQAQNASNTKVPMWMIGLVCFLGMDEILTVLRNPLLMFFLIVVGGGAFMAHQVGALKPIIAVATTTATQIIKQIQVGFTPVPVPAAGTPAARSSASRRSSVNRSHVRNLSLSKSYSESTPAHSRGSSATFDLISPATRANQTLEMQEMVQATISPRDSPVVEEEVDVTEESTPTSGVVKRVAARAPQAE